MKLHGLEHDAHEATLSPSADTSYKQECPRLPIDRGWRSPEAIMSLCLQPGLFPWGLCKRTIFFRQHHRTENSQVWRSHMPGFKSCLYHLLALWPWVSLSLHMCIVGIIIVTIQLVWPFNKYSLSTYSVPDLGGTAGNRYVVPVIKEF